MSELELRLDFPGVILTLNNEVLLLRSWTPLHTMASAVVGGGLSRVRYILHKYVNPDYSYSDPEGELKALARNYGVTEPFVGLMTSVPLCNGRTTSLREGPLAVAAIVTAGLSHPSAPGLSLPVTFTPGTINMIVLVDAQLTPAAMVNSVITVTEVKAQVLMQRGILTRQGHPATGTSTDAVAIACTGRGGPLPYAGPATPVGWLIGRSVRAALEEALL